MERVTYDFFLKIFTEILLITVCFFVCLLVYFTHCYIEEHFRICNHSNIFKLHLLHHLCDSIIHEYGIFLTNYYDLLYCVRNLLNGNHLFFLEHFPT